MASPRKILTRHPDPAKQGTNIDGDKYDTVRGAICQALLEADGEMTFKALNQAVATRLRGTFEGAITWYVVTVKLDLEARGELLRVPKVSPQRVRLRG